MVSTSGLRAAHPDGLGFWKLARRDVVTFGSFLLLTIACLIQAIAIGMVFWSRIHFGSNFNPIAYSEFQIIKSNQSVTDALGLDAAQKARNRSRAPVQDQATLMLKRASHDLDLARTRQKEIQLIEGETEKKAQSLVRLSEEAWARGAFDEAIRHLQTAVQNATDYLPAIKTLAARHEERGDFEQARFQWEKIAGIARPESADMVLALEHLQRLAPTTTVFRPALTPRDQLPAKTPAAVLAIPQTPPAVLSLIEIKQTDLSLDDLYDLRFNLRFTLGSRGAEPAIDIAQTRVEVTFYDQSLSAGGALIPLKTLSTNLQPRQSWRAGDRQVLSLNYTIPKGYLRKKVELFGGSYRFCGYVVRLFYRNQLQDSHAQPANPLAAFAH